MFSLFKRNKEKQIKAAVELALSVFSLMPEKYSYIVTQLKEGIITGVKSDTSFVNYTRFSLDVKLLNKHENKKGAPFVMKGIRVYDFNKNDFTDIYFYIGYGLLLGYSTPELKEIKPDTTRVDVSKHFAEFFVNDDYEKIKPILNKKELALINSNDVYEVELNGKIYYHLKDLEDGDFIGIDKKKKVYKITHDPFEIVEQNIGLLELLA